MENEYVQDVEAYLNEPVKIRLFRDNDRYRDRNACHNRRRYNRNYSNNGSCNGHSCCDPPWPITIGISQIHRIIHTIRKKIVPPNVPANTSNL